LASGLVATEEVKTDVLNAPNKELEDMTSFGDGRLAEDGTKDFYATPPQLQLKTFSRSGRKKRGSEATQASVLKYTSTRDLFGCHMVIGQTQFYGNNSMVVWLDSKRLHKADDDAVNWLVALWLVSMVATALTK